MTLTLGNDLTGTVSREVGAASRTAAGLGESLITGNDKFVEVVDGFLGSSLRDSEIFLGAIAKNTAYSINMLTITDEYLKTVGTSLQEGLKTIGSSGPISQDKLAVLQKNLNDKKDQVALLIKTADFDGKALLAGGAGKVDVQVGLSIADRFTIRVGDISTPKLFRTGAANAINDWIAGNMARTTAYNDTALFADAVSARTNFSQEAALTTNELAAAIVATRSGNSSFARLEAERATGLDLLDTRLRTDLTANITALIQVDAGITADANTNAAAIGAAAAYVNGLQAGDDNATIIAAVNAAANGAANANAGAIGNAAGTIATNLLGGATLNATLQAHTYFAADANTAAIANAVDAAIAANVGADLATISAAVNAAANGAANANGGVIGNAAEQIFLAHNTGVTLGTAKQTALEAAMGNAPAKAELVAHFADNQTTDLTTDTGRSLAQDVFTAALNTIRAQQAAVSNQKQNVIEAADALRATTNVTQKAADSYLKTDYVMTAQQYSETIRTMVASITALQAANKIPEAAQRLIDALAR